MEGGAAHCSGSGFDVEVDGVGDVKTESSAAMGLQEVTSKTVLRMLRRSLAKLVCS